MLAAIIQIQQASQLQDDPTQRLCKALGTLCAIAKHHTAARVTHVATHVQSSKECMKDLETGRLPVTALVSTSTAPWTAEDQRHSVQAALTAGAGDSILAVLAWHALHQLPHM